MRATRAKDGQALLETCASRELSDAERTRRNGGQALLAYCAEHVPTVLSAGAIGTRRRKQDGQALIEMSIVAVLFVLLMLGLVDFAWDFLQLHMVTQATSVAARTVSALSHPFGDSSAQTALAKQIVTEQVSGYATVDPNNVTVKLMNQTKGATPCVTAGTKAQVTVQVTGTINDVFAMLLKKATLLNFTRTETFLDEGQS